MKKPIDDLKDWMNGQIKRKAYLKWQEAGRPQNQDVHFWKQAEEEFDKLYPLPQAIGWAMVLTIITSQTEVMSIIERYKDKVLVGEHGYPKENESIEEYYKRIECSS